MKTSDEPIVIEQLINAPAETVWAAITEPDRMVRWFFDNIPDFKPEVGFATRFDIECKGRRFPHLWKITAVHPGKSITYDWRYEGYEGAAAVTFELVSADEATRVRLTNRVVEDFQEGIPEFTREAGVGGWSYFIQDRLKEYLEPGS